MREPEPPESAWAGARFRGVIETIVDGVIIIDAEGSIRLYNEACQRIFGHRIVSDDPPHRETDALQITRNVARDMRAGNVHQCAGMR